MGLVTRAAALAKDAHAGQFRKYNGRPYIEHPGRVAMQVTLHGGSAEMIAAAWLHDVLEDTKCPWWQIVSECGDTVYEYVKQLTNTKNYGNPLPSREERKRQDRQRIAFISAPAKMIKVFDRIDNLRDMEGGLVDFRAKYLDESLQLAGVLTDERGGTYVELLFDEIRLQRDKLYEVDLKIAS